MAATHRCRAWLVTVDEPKDEHYKELTSGDHSYAVWRTEDGVLQAVLYYHNVKVRPRPVWQHHDYQQIDRIVPLIVDCTDENGWEDIGIRPVEGPSRWIQDNKRSRRNLDADTLPKAIMGDILRWRNKKATLEDDIISAEKKLILMVLDEAPTTPQGIATAMKRVEKKLNGAIHLPVGKAHR